MAIERTTGFGRDRRRGEPSSAVDDSAQNRNGARRPGSSTILRWLAGAVVLWLLAAAYLMYDAQRHARNAEASLRDVADIIQGADLAGIDFAAVEIDLTAGSEELSAARRSINSPVVRALGPLPVIGRQLDSARSLIVTSDDLASALQPLVRSARTAQEEPNAVDRVAFLEDTTAELAELRSVINTADLGPPEYLLGPLADARVELAGRLADLEVEAEQYEAVTAGLASFFDDSTYLVLGANNAEMQIGGGMHLSVGKVEVANGDFELPGLEPSSSLFPVDSVPVVDADVEARWGFLSPANDFRKLNYSLRFNEFGGPQALSMWEAQTGERLDGVLSIDPFVLDAILSVVGEVDVEGQVYGAGEALLYLLRDQYTVFDNSDGDRDTEELIDQRQDRLSLIANAAVEKLATSSWDPIELLEVLRPLARGRHMMAYSDRPQDQAAWVALGVDGSVPPNGTGVGLINDGGSKLDPFISLSVDATFDDVAGERTITYDIELENDAPQQGLPRKIVGPWRGVGLPSPGTWYGALVIHVPGWADQPGFIDDRPLAVGGPDGDLLVIATQPFAVEPGDREQFTFSFVLPTDASALRLISSARFPAVAWTWGGTSLTDRVAVDLE